MNTVNLNGMTGWLIGSILIGTPVLAIASVIAPVNTVNAGSYKSYVNPRYRYRICYPPGVMRPLPEAGNGDGRSFVAADHGRLSAFGRNNVDGSSLKATADANAADLAGARGRISYRVTRPGWTVFSGENGNAMLFYSKIIQRRDQFLIFELTYPRGLADRYKPVVEQISRCFSSTG